MRKLSEILSPEKRLTARDRDAEISDLASDSRGVKPGTLFFAIRGTEADGHDFVETAIANGAAAVVVERPEMAELPGAIVVASTRRTLAETAAAWFGHPSRKLSLVGVTGTNGKTTSTYLLWHAWKKLGLRAGLVGTVAYHIGERSRESRLTTPGPLELQELLAEMVEERVTHAAMEASSIALAQDRVAGTHFRVALFTNLTLDHLDYHGTLESYLEAKLRLFREMRPEWAVLNRDDAAFEKILAATTAENRLTYSLSSRDADIVVEEANFTADGIDAKLRGPEGTFRLAAPLLGRHNLANSLGAIATCLALGIKPSDAAAALSDCLGAPGRLERVDCGADRPRVFVDYAHSPDALENVLGILGEIRAKIGHGKLITVFGCGGDRDRTKRPYMARAVSSASDVTVVTSDNPRFEDPESILDEIEPGVLSDRTRYVRQVNRRAAIHEALSMASPDDIVLIAGKGHENYQIVGGQKLPFDDRAVVKDFYQLEI